MWSAMRWMQPFAANPLLGSYSEGHNAFRITPSRRHIKQPQTRGTMKMLGFILDLFVNTFGITRPEPGQEARAGRFIALMLFSVLLGLAIAIWLLRRTFTQ
jgi:hypothetical protein